MQNVITESTRDRVLHAACGLFARHGFQRTTTQMICEEAGANIAAVNYHFGGKKNLYLAVWEHVFEDVSRRLDDILDAEGVSSEEKLRRHIRMRVQSAMSEGESGWFGRLVHWEVTQPTAAHRQIHERFLKHVQARFRDLIRGVLGDDIDDKTARLAGFCVHSPIIHLNEVMRTPGTKARLRDRLASDPDALVRVLHAFALAGLREVNRQYEEGELE